MKKKNTKNPLEMKKNPYVCSVQVYCWAVNPSVLRCNPGIFYAPMRHQIWRCANPVTRLQWPVGPTVGLEQREVVRRFFVPRVQNYCIMQNAKMTAGETAQRTLVIFRDCHKKNNIVIPIVSDYEERFYRHFAHRMGWLCTIRKPKAHTELTKATVWRKPVAIAARPRPQLGGAFNLTLTDIKEGDKQ